MYRLILLLVLAACGPRPDAPSEPTFRAKDAPIYSSAVIDPSRLSGNWVQVATFAPAGQADCAPGQVDMGDGSLRWTLCLADGIHSGDGPMVPGKPGRFEVQGLADWWVLWVDGDYRTLVVGTPSGDFGFVLNRDANVPPDRLKAVRDILQFNGYAMDKLAVF